MNLKKIYHCIKKKKFLTIIDRMVYNIASFGPRMS